MKIGITGSSGLIGSLFIMKYGHDYDLIPFSGDMTDFEAVNKFMKIDFDIVFHLASVIPKYDMNGMPLHQSFSSNIVGTKNIAKAASEFNTKVIFTSTQRVYENKNQLKIIEEDKLKPDDKDEYGESKLESEQILQNFLKPGNFVILRISNIYGTSPARFSIIDSIAESIVLDKEVKIGLNIKILRDYIHIDDLLTALNLSIKHKGIFNICEGKSYDGVDLINFFKMISGKTPKIIFGNNSPNDIVLDNTKAKNEMGFIPKYNLSEGIKNILFDMKKYYEKK
jgi:nucleoside-diphosphate-sugar epimerase